MKKKYVKVKGVDIVAEGKILWTKMAIVVSCTYYTPVSVLFLIFWSISYWCAPTYNMEMHQI